MQAVSITYRQETAMRQASVWRALVKLPRGKFVFTSLYLL